MEDSSETDSTYAIMEAIAAESSDQLGMLLTTASSSLLCAEESAWSAFSAAGACVPASSDVSAVSSAGFCVPAFSEVSAAGSACFSSPAVSAPEFPVSAASTVVFAAPLSGSCVELPYTAVDSSRHMVIQIAAAFLQLLISIPHFL